MKEFEIKINELQANLLQRMIVEEIEQQERWMKEEKKKYNNPILQEEREEYIEQLEQLSDEIEKKGCRRYVKV